MGTRFVYGAAAALAVVFMVAIALVQLRVNGARGLRDGSFIGLDVAVGLIAFRSGMVIAGAYAKLSRTTRGRRSGND